MTPPSAPELRNIQAIIGLERDVRERRSVLDRVTDGVSSVASSPVFLIAHITWFSGWMALNTLGWVTFDPYPFSLLTLAVGLEAIVLTGFVLMAQGRMTHQADKRAHLDLQINLLAEQELTAILKMQCLLAEHAGIDITGIDPRLDHMRGQTDVQRLANTIETEMAATESDDPEQGSAVAPGPIVMSEPSSAGTDRRAGHLRTAGVFAHRAGARDRRRPLVGPGRPDSDRP